MEKVSHSIKKLVKSLDAVKFRRLNNAFKAEGTKCVCDTLNYFNVRMMVAKPEWIEKHVGLLPDVIKIFEANGGDMEQMTSLSTAPEVIAVYKIPVHDGFEMAKDELVLALDAIQDPGNLGTIVRLADWFGIKKILCGEGTADIFSPKSVMATMGAISRVKLYYCDLKEELLKLKDVTPIYGAMLSGENIFKAPLSKGGIIVMGNEGRGVSPEVSALFSNHITIPCYPEGEVTSESLNVAMATGIIVSQFRSRIF